MNILENPKQNTTAETTDFETVTDRHYLLCLVVLTALGVWKNGVPAFWTAAATVVSAVLLYAIFRRIGGAGKKRAGSARGGNKIKAALPVINSALAAACLFAPVMPLHILIFAGAAVALSMYVLPMFSSAAVAVALSAAMFPADFIRFDILNYGFSSYDFSNFAGIHSDMLSGGFTAVVVAAAVYLCIHRAKQLLPVIIPVVLISALPTIVSFNLNINGRLNIDAIFAAVFLLYIPAAHAAPRTYAGRAAYGVFAGVCGLLFVHSAKTDYPLVYAALLSNAFACGADGFIKYYNKGMTAMAAMVAGILKRRHTYDTISNTVSSGDDFIPEQDATREIDFLNYNMPEITSKVTKSKRKSNLFLSILSVLKRNIGNKKTPPPNTPADIPNPPPATSDNPPTLQTDQPDNTNTTKL